MLSHLSRQRQGEAFALALALIEGWFPIFAFYLVSALGSIHAYFYSLVVATLWLFSWLIWQGKLGELKQRQAYWSLAMTSFWITSLYLLVFIALQFTSASHVAIILFLQVLFSYLWLGRQQAEKMQPVHLLGVLSMSLGALIILFPNELSLNIGDVLVLLAAMIAPLANIWQKRARNHVSSETILAVRGLIALPFIYLALLWLEPEISWDDLQAQWLWILLTGSLVFVVSKIFWIEALHRLPITKVNALYAFSPLLTLIFAYYWLNETPSVAQLIGIVPILVGGYWITRKNIH